MFSRVSGPAVANSSSHLRPGRRGRALIAAVAVAAVVSGGLLSASAAWAATGTLSSLDLTVTADGTAPFDGSDGSGEDSDALNGIVRTNDSVTYRWEYSVAVAGDVTFVQALPSGMVWDSTSTASCSEGAGGISSDGRTLTCTLTGLNTGAGAYPVSARVLTIPDRTVLDTSVTSGALQSNTAEVTASAAPKLAPDLQSLGAIVAANGPGAQSGVPGFNISMTADLFMPVDATRGTRGLEPGAAPLTFKIDLPSNFSGGLLAAGTNCTTNTGVAPLGAGGGSSAVVNSGAVACAQGGGADSPVTVTFADPDQSLLSYPSNIGPHNPGAYFAASKIVVWYPASSFPVGVTTPGTFQLSGFAPTGATGSVNYGGFAPGQEPGAACETTPARNCVTVNILRPAAPQLSGAAALTTSSTAFNAPLPDATSAVSGDGPIYWAQKYYAVAAMNVSGGSPDATNPLLCITWNQSLESIDPSRSVNTTRSGVSTSNVVVEYGSVPYPDDAARRAPDCGSAGDGAPDWSSTIAGAGGPASVTAVRVRFLDPAPGGTGMNLFVPLTRTTASTAPGTPLPIFSNFTADGAFLANSSYNPATNTGTNGSRGLAADAKVRATTDWDTSAASPGEIHKITVTPSVTNDYSDRTATGVTVTATLSTPCAAYQEGSASIAPTSITPATVNCADGGSGQVITWNLGDIPTGTAVPPITFSTIIDPSSPIPSSDVVTSVISSPSDPAREAVRTSTDDLSVNAVAEFGVTKTASVAAVTPGQPFTYTIGWANRLSVSVGTASFVDVLPFNGDDRGTTGLSDLSVVSVTPRSGTTGVVVSYTSDPAAGVEAAVAADPSGATGITWVSTKPATVTAIRFTTPELTPGTVQAMDVTVSAGEFSRAGVMVNDVSGRATDLPVPVQAAAEVSLESTAAELSGSVYNDVDKSGGRNAGDTPVPNPDVRISTGYEYGPNGIDDGGTGDDIAVTTPFTATSQADGTYDFPGLPPGSYTVTVIPPAGSHVAVTPPMPVKLAANATVTGVDFGLQLNPDPTTSTITASPTQITADGSSTSTVTVALLDVNGDPVTDAGDAVTLTTSAGTLGPVTDNGDGTYTATLTSSTKVETATIGFAVDGTTAAATTQVEFVAGPPDPGMSTIVASPAQITADGSSTSTVTVTLLDVNGNPVTGDAVTLTTSAGTLGPVTDNGDGTYTATLTSSTKVETATIGYAVDGTTADATAQVKFVAGPPNPTMSTITASPAQITADGSSTSTVTVTLLDVNGNPVTGDAVTLTTSAGTLGPVTDNGDGTYTATLTSSTTVDTATIGYAVDGTLSDATTQVEFVAGPPDPGTSTIIAVPNEILANGTSTSQVTVTLRDANGNLVTDAGDVVTMTTTAGTLGPVTDQQNGTYTATLTSSTKVETATIGYAVASTKTTAAIKVAAAALATTTTTVKFIAIPPDAGTSTIAASPNEITADGTSTSTITVTLRDANGDLVTNAGDAVTMTTTAGTLGPVTDNHDGTYTATLTSSTTVETATIGFAVNGTTATATTTVEFVAGPPSPTPSPSSGTSSAVPSGTLPVTGGGVPSWMLLAGLFLIAAGTVLIRHRHRRNTRSTP